MAQQYPGLRGWHAFHLRKRLQRCEFDQLATYCSAEGTHLDIGCGHGHFLVYLRLFHNSDGRLIGTDIDKKKLSVAGTAAETNRIELHEGDCVENADLPREFDTISLIDVIYLLPWQRQLALFSWINSRLKPGGRLIIRSIALDQGTRTARANWQEFVMVHILRATQSSGTLTGARSLEAYSELFEQYGLEEQARHTRSIPSPSFVLVLRKPEK